MLPLIAIADDEVVILDMLDLLLAMDGYRTVSTVTAAAVPALIQQHGPALLILDVCMEQRDSGWQVLDILGTDPATRQLPVIVCSAEYDLPWRVARRGDPYTVRVSKPFNPPQLLVLVQGVVDHPAGRAPSAEDAGAAAQ